MMLIALLLAGGLAWWLYQRGELLPNLLRYGGTAAAALLAFKMLEDGKPLFALLAAGAGALWWVLRRARAADPAALAEARALLGVSADAGPEAVNAAWRAQIARVHPDAGGTAALAARVTAARDLLLTRR